MFISPSASAVDSENNTELGVQELVPRRGSGGGGGGGRKKSSCPRTTTITTGTATRTSSTTTTTTTYATPIGPQAGVPSLLLIPKEPLDIVAFGRKTAATPFGSGGEKEYTIADGQPFAGRKVGGATRAQVYGNSIYGSGYPNQPQRGVEGKNFPFVFHPVVFLDGEGPQYFYRQVEYHDVTDTTRPGGPLYEFTVSPQGRCGKPPPFNFHVIADRTTVEFLHTAISYACTAGNASPDGMDIGAPHAYTSTTNQSLAAKPWEAIQFYRASSVVLTLDGYNNSAAWVEDVGVESTPIPDVVSTHFLGCVNETIGVSVPLVGHGSTITVPSFFSLLFLVWVMVFSL